MKEDALKAIEDDLKYQRITRYSDAYATIEELIAEVRRQRLTKEEFDFVQEHLIKVLSWAEDDDCEALLNSILLKMKPPIN